MPDRIPSLTAYSPSVPIPSGPGFGHTPPTPPVVPPPSTDPYETDLLPGQEPTTTGTLFLMLIFLMLIAGFWGMMYVMLLHR